MLKIKTNSLKAAVTMAATKDSRHYLNGVCIHVDRHGDVYLRSTQGVYVFEDQMPDKCTEQVGPFEIIIPLDAAKTASKSKADKLELSAMPDGKYILGDVVFTALLGKFPDTDLVFPVRNSCDDNVHANYDFEFLAICQNAMRLATGNKKAYFRLQNSLVGLICRETETYPRCAISPLNGTKAFKGN